MELERVQVELRPRSYAEAVDLGFRMGRLWWKPMAASWALTVAPILLLAMLTAWRMPWLTLVLLWWLKPLIERVPLGILSRALFGQEPSVREGLRRIPQLFLHRDAVLLLTLYRFDPFRSVRMPIWQLEQPNFKTKRARASLLFRGVEAQAFAVTTLCLLFEWILIATPLLLSPMFVSKSTLSRFGDALGFEGLAAVPTPLAWAFVLLWASSAAIVHPFFVGAGFSLYLNRRTHLEAWDIEVAFRRMARRLSGVAAAALLVLIVGCGMLFAAEPASEAGPQPGPDPREVITEVLADPVFGDTRTEASWDFNIDTEPSENAPIAGSGILGSLLASMLVPLLWIVVVVGVGILAVQILIRVSPGAGLPVVRSDGAARRPQQLFGLDLTDSSLPNDVVGTARALWLTGQARAAIGLLYRAAVARLVSADGFIIKESATEGECLRAVAANLSAERLVYFRLLTECWQTTAYGHRTPDAELATTLLDHWNAQFGAHE